MIGETFWRMILAAGLVGLGMVAYWVVNRFLLARAGRRLQADQARGGQAAGLEAVDPGTPVLLYFTTPTCAPCKTIQRPAIQKVRELMGDCLQVVEIDATQRPEVASHWGVMSVPTTFILDANGQPRHVNHGVANADKLLKQLVFS
jgi:thiol-disulfide isomerase/thioredoxin